MTPIQLLKLRMELTAANRTVCDLSLELFRRDLVELEAAEAAQVATAAASAPAKAMTPDAVAPEA